ncbi:MAG: hypothetical protein HKM93_00820 [Desulfobacteraceae bacterium]|nr:hypothetical protein [Desulfobacteraceae bacterium]
MGGLKTHFHYADEGLIGEYDAAGTEIKTYGYKPGSTWTTDPLFMKVGGEYYFYHNDHLGTPQKITAVNGSVVWSAVYTAFGKATVDPSSTVVSNLRFAGQYFDEETGLHYNYQRYHDPGVGRYLRVDPIGFIGGINIYLYARNNPTTMFDMNGLKCWKTFSFDIPWFSTLIDSQLIFESEWSLGMYSPEISIPVNPIRRMSPVGPNTVLSKHGIAHCSASKYRDYQDTYK